MGIGIFLLFVGFIAGGIDGRVTLLSHRGGWFLEGEAQKPAVIVFLDLIGWITGIAAMILSFMLFDWWVPVVALTVGYWVVAPIVVNLKTIAFFYGLSPLTKIVKVVCSIFIVAIYFDLG